MSRAQELRRSEKSIQGFTKDDLAAEASSAAQSTGSNTLYMDVTFQEAKLTRSQSSRRGMARSLSAKVVQMAKDQVAGGGTASDGATPAKNALHLALGAVFEWQRKLNADGRQS